MKKNHLYLQKTILIIISFLLINSTGIYLFYTAILAPNLYAIQATNQQLLTAEATYQQSLYNYQNLQTNLQTLYNLRQQPRLIHYQNLSHTFANIYNLKHLNGITSSTLHVSTRQHIIDTLWLSPFTVSGYGNIAQIMAYLHNLNHTNATIHINEVNITINNYTQDMYATISMEIPFTE